MKLPSTTGKTAATFIQQLAEVIALLGKDLRFQLKIVSLRLQLFYARLQIRHLSARVAKLSFQKVYVGHVVTATKVQQCLEPIQGVHQAEVKSPQPQEQAA